jgi:hypothetical protein
MCINTNVGTDGTILMDDYDDSCAEYEAMPHWCG